MQILKTTLIEFDEVAERARLVANFNGAERTALVSILSAFVAGDWGKCYGLLQALTSEQREYVHQTLFETMRAWGIRNKRKAAHVPHAGQVGHERVDYPKFDINGFSDL